MVLYRIFPGKTSFKTPAFWRPMIIAWENIEGNSNAWLANLTCSRHARRSASPCKLPLASAAAQRPGSAWPPPPTAPHLCLWPAGGTQQPAWPAVIAHHITQFAIVEHASPTGYTASWSSPPCAAATVQLSTKHAQVLAARGPCTAGPTHGHRSPG